MNLLVTPKYVMRRKKKVMTARGCLPTSFHHVAQSEQVTCGGWSEGRASDEKHQQGVLDAKVGVLGI